MSTTRQVENFANKALQDWGLASKGWCFAWNNRKTALGLCNYTNKTIYVSRFLLAAIPAHRQYREIQDTVLHEVAHALAGGRAKHGPVWRSWARKVGAKPERCVADGILSRKAIAQKSKYVATCEKCGLVHGFSRMGAGWQRGDYTHKNCGGSFAVTQNW